MQQALLRYYGNAIKLIVTQHTQQELLRYYGNLLCHYIIYYYFTSWWSFVPKETNF
jgi:hypothetical protein